MARQILGKVVPTGEDTYDNNRTYDELCIVMYNGQSYISKKETRGNKPDNTEYWQQLVEKPVKGNDYFTEADKDEIVNDVTNDATNKYNQAVATGIKTFNQNAERKTSDFNDNASEKTDTYNANADSTTQAFTNNANSKTEAYNTNAAEKLNTYNSNHTAKLKEYNDNATSKLSAYDTNTVTKTNEYNSNHTNKLNAYDTNASNKVDTYNTNADTRLEEYNTNTNNKIAEYDEHSKELNNKIVSTRNELERLKSNVLNTGEDTDTFIHLEDSAMAEMKEIKVDGVLQQNTTQGYQLLNIDFPESELNGLKFKPNGKNSFTISGTSTANINYRIASKIPSKLINKKVILWVDGITSGIFNIGYKNSNNGNNVLVCTPSDKKVVVTITEGMVKNADIFDLFILANNTINTTINVSLELGETKHPFEPYTGGQPSPSPDYPQPISVIENSLKITSCNKNLFKMNDNYSKGYTTTKNGITLKVEDDLSITLKGTTTNKTEFFLFGSWGIKNNRYIPKGIFTISQNGFVDGITSNLGLFKDGVNVQNKRLTYTNTTITFNSSLIDFDGMSYAIEIADGKTIDTRAYTQIESNKKATSFEQHLETQIEVNLPEGEFIGKIDDTYKDTLRTKYFLKEGQYHWMLDKKIGKYVLNGSEHWILDNYASTNYYRYSTKIPNLTSSVSKGVQAMNSHFKQRIYENHGDYEYLYVQSSENSGVIYIQSQKWVSVNELKTWLASNNVEVYYALATPYTRDLGVIDMPMSYKDITNIFTDSDLLPTINAKYYRVFEKTIQNAQINEKTLKQEITDLNATVSALDNRLKALETKTVEEPTESEGTV